METVVLQLALLAAPGDSAPDMEQYLRYLIAHAPKRPVFKIVRGDFRGDWLRKRFPEVTIIHMLRNPRDLWTSSVGRNSTLEIHPKYGAFRHYLDLMCKDLGLQVPGLCTGSFICSGA